MKKGDIKMSKELKALEVIKIATTAYEAYANNAALQESVKIIEKYLKRDRALKPRNYGDNVSYCPNCSSIVNIIHQSHHCSECGQRLDWSEER